MMKMTKNQKLVYEAVQSDQRAAEEDHVLLAKVWERDWDYSKSLEENLRRLPNPETLTRCRRRLHELGLIHYSEETDKRRMEQFNEHREQYSPTTLGIEVAKAKARDPFMES